MKKFSEFARGISEKKQYTRESFIKGKMFSVGDLVESSTGTAEIISIGTNYVTVVKNGAPVKWWAEDCKLVEQKHNTPPTKTFNGSLSFRGYIAKKFDSTLSDQFIEAFEESSDPYAFYKCIRLCDSLLKANANTLISGYDKYMEEFKSAKSYLESFGIENQKIQVIGEALDIIKEELEK